MGWSIFIVFERSNVCIFFFFIFLFWKSSSYCSSSTILELRGRKNLMVLLMESIDWKYTTEYSLFYFFCVLFCSVLLHKMRRNGFSIFFLAEIENKTFISQMKLFNLVSDVMNEMCWLCSVLCSCGIFFGMFGIIYEIFEWELYQLELNN